MERPSALVEGCWRDRTKKKKIEKELTDMDHSVVIVGWKRVEVEEGMGGGGR